MFWEYYTCQVHVWDETVTTEDGDKKNLGDYLDTMGQKGWELVAVACAEKATTKCCISRDQNQSSPLPYFGESIDRR